MYSAVVASVGRPARCTKLAPAARQSALRVDSRGPDSYHTHVAGEKPFQRSSQRFDVSLSIQYKSIEAADWTTASTINLSLAGAFVESTERLSFGTKVDLKFQVPTQKEAIAVGAHVRWSADNGFGVQFEGLRARDVWALGKYFEQLSQ